MRTLLDGGNGLVDFERLCEWRDGPGAQPDPLQAAVEKGERIWKDDNLVSMLKWNSNAVATEVDEMGEG